MPYRIIQENQTTAPTGKFRTVKEPAEAYRGAILPLSRDVEGNISFAVPGLIKGVLDTLNKSGEALRTGDTSPEGVESMIGLGALGTPVSPAAGTGMAIAKAAGYEVPRAVPPTPSGEALRSAGGEGIERATNMGVEYSPEAVVSSMGNLRQELYRKGFREKQAPLAFDIINDLSTPPIAGAGERVGIDLADLHSARKSLGNAAKDFNNPTEQAVASIAIEELDRFIAAADPSSVVAGPAAAAGKLFDESLGNYAAGMRSGKLQGLEESATRRAEASNSGRNLDNTIRQRVASLLDQPKNSRGFNEIERERMDQLSRGNFVRNRVRDAGNYLGGGGGLGGVVAGGVGGATVGGIGGAPVLGILAGAGVPALGWAFKGAGNRMTKRQLALIDELTRQRSPLYERMLAEAPDAAMPGPTKQAALVRALLSAAAVEREARN